MHPNIPLFGPLRITINNTLCVYPAYPPRERSRVVLRLLHVIMYYYLLLIILRHVVIRDARCNHPHPIADPILGSWDLGILGSWDLGILGSWYLGISDWPIRDFTIPEYGELAEIPLFGVFT